MDPKKIILSTQPGLLGEMIKKAFLHNSSLQIVGETTNLRDLSTLIQQTGAEWVLVTLSMEGAFPIDTQSLLTQHPKVSILAISMDGSEVKLRWIDHHEKEYQNPTLKKITSIIFNNPAKQPEFS